MVLSLDLINNIYSAFVNIKLWYLYLLIFNLQVDKCLNECFQIISENVDHKWSLAYEDGDMKV